MGLFDLFKKKSPVQPAAHNRSPIRTEKANDVPPEIRLAEAMQYIQMMKDSIQLISTTLYCKTFFYRYDFALENAEKVLRLSKGLRNEKEAQDMLDVLAAEDCRDGVMHCFSGSVETAKILLDRGLYLGVGGSLTFKNAVKAIEVVQYAPIDRLLLETDSPYLAPVPLRGKRNDPANTRLVAHRIAEIKGMDAEEAAEIMFENGKKLFRI